MRDAAHRPSGRLLYPICATPPLHLLHALRDRLRRLCDDLEARQPAQAVWAVRLDPHERLARPRLHVRTRVLSYVVIQC